RRARGDVRRAGRGPDRRGVHPSDPGRVRERGRGPLVHLEGLTQGLTPQGLKPKADAMTASTAMLNAAVAVFLAAPFLAGLLSLVIRPSRGLHALNFSTMVALALAEMVLTGHVLVGRPVTALGGLVYLDALSVFILFVISAVGLTSSLYMWSYLDDQVAR